MFTRSPSSRHMVQVINGRFCPIESKTTQEIKPDTYADHESVKPDVSADDVEARLAKCCHDKELIRELGVTFRLFQELGKIIKRSMRELDDINDDFRSHPEDHDRIMARITEINRELAEKLVRARDDLLGSEDSIITQSGIKALNRELSIEDEPLADKTKDFFRFEHEIRSLQLLMMVPNSYLNAYVDRSKVVPKEHLLGFRLIARYHRQAENLEKYFGISLLTGHVFGTEPGKLDKLLGHGFTPTQLHIAAMRKLGLVTKSTKSELTLSSADYAEIVTLDGQIYNQLRGDDEVTEPAVEEQVAKPADDPVPVTTDKTTEEIAPAVKTPTDHEQMIKRYLHNSKVDLSAEAAAIFKYPFEKEYLAQHKVWWNNAFLNAYAAYEACPGMELDPAMAKDIEELKVIHRQAIEVAPFSLFVANVWESISKETFDQLLKELKFTPEKVNEAIMVAANFIATEDLICVTPAEAEKFEKEIVRLSERLIEEKRSAEQQANDLRTDPIDTKQLGDEIDRCLKPEPKPTSKSSQKKKKGKK